MVKSDSDRSYISAIAFHKRGKASRQSQVPATLSSLSLLYICC